MFRKLQIKMVLLNLAVVMAIIIAIMGLTFFSSISILRRQAETVKARIEENGVDFSKGPGNYYNALVLGNRMIPIPVDSTGQLIQNDQFPGMGIGENTYRQDLYELIEENMPDMKYIRHDDRTYFTFHIVSGDITYYFFIDATQEREMIRQLMKNTIFIGLFALVMVIISSIFLTKRALIPVTKAWNKQRRFISDASHELRTPLAVIKTNMEVLDEDDAATIGSQRKWINNVNAEIDRMTGLIENLLFLSKKDLIKKEKHYTNIFLDEHVGKAVSSLRKIAEDKGISLKASLEKVSVQTPGFEIYRLAVILIENAIKYTDHGSIEVRTYKDDKNAVLMVKDSGIGIEKEKTDRIFERFYRVDEARDRKTGGYGLGLSIAGSICDSYNGKISVESEQGKGSVFTVVFPAVK